MKQRRYNWTVFIVFLFICTVFITAYQYRFVLKLAGYYPVFAGQTKSGSDYMYRVKPSSSQLLILHGLDSNGNENKNLHKVAQAIADEQGIEVSLPLIKSLAGYRLDEAYEEVYSIIQEATRSHNEVRIISICVVTPYVLGALNRSTEEERNKVKGVFYFVPIFTGRHIVKKTGSDYFSSYTRAIYTLRNSSNQTLQNEIRSRFTTVKGYKQKWSDDQLDKQVDSFINKDSGKPNKLFSYPQFKELKQKSLVMCSTQDKFIPVTECRELLHYLREQSGSDQVKSNFIDHEHGSLSDLIESFVFDYDRQLTFFKGFFAK